MLEDRWEIGSEFHWSLDYTKPRNKSAFFQRDYELFATGRAALISLLLFNRNRGERVALHLPSFFCMGVAASLAKYFDLRWYRDIPTDSAPDFDSIEAKPGEAVVAVNFFGARAGKAWRQWQSKRDDIILIEDHTHDPFSSWAKNSSADYAFVSLRKTLPLPDGAILWSPRGRDLPAAISPQSRGAQEKLDGMIYKMAYLAGGNALKERFRELQIRGEDSLEHETNAAASKYTKAALKSIAAEKLSKLRKRNVLLFLESIEREARGPWAPLFTSWPKGATPFNPILVCETPAIRDALQKYLIGENIYPAIHWRQEDGGLSSGGPEAVALGKRIITIPVDFRCSIEDIDRIVKIMKRFTIV